jgi:hypothetical protein
MALHACSGWGAHSNPPSLQEADAGVVAAVGMPLVSTDVPVNATALRSYCCWCVPAICAAVQTRIATGLNSTQGGPDDD